MSQARPPSADANVDALLLATRGDRLQWSFALPDLPRIAEQVGERAGRAELIAEFRKIDDRVMIDGSVAATLRLRCRRCMQPLDVRVEDDFNLVVVDSDAELEKLSEAQDAVVANASHLDLAWLTEEQLLLAAPLAPAHDDEAACQRAGATLSLQESGGPPAAGASSPTQRPFAGLREMLKKS